MNGKHTTFFKAALAASKRVRSHKVSATWEHHLEFSD
jgi:hypothetical protein